VILIGASFGGGISSLFAARHPEDVRALVLLNPLLDYKNRFIDQKPYWHDDQLDEEAGLRLTECGYLEHSPTFRLGRPLLNEVFYLRPDRELGGVIAPTLIVHGTKDTFIPVDSSRSAVAQFGGEAHLVTVDGAQHGFAVHDDPAYANPQTQSWQAIVIRTVTDWACEQMGTEGPPSP
jgi:pimeloyl-ACP methyl ester carboxylesterase